MINIRTHKRIDIPFRLKWLNNPKVNKYIGDELGQRTTLAKQEKWFNDYQKDKNKIFFTILFDNKPICLVGLSNISKQNGNADLFIMIGDDKFRGKGFGKEAMKWIIEYGFKKLKLYKINLGVIEDNKVAVRLYKKLEFKVEGKMIDEVYYKNKFYNFLLMALFKKTYKAN